MQLVASRMSLMQVVISSILFRWPQSAMASGGGGGGVGGGVGGGGGGGGVKEVGC